MSLKSQIESLLFVSNKPLTVKELAKLLEKPESEILPALEELKNDKRETGVVVLENKNEYQLSTNSENSTLVKNFLNTELREKLTDATIEVLAIIAYRQPISKAEIEAIRGVNSQYSVRHLLMRGLIEKVSNPTDARSSLYQTTTEFLQHLGLTSVNDLPEFEKLVGQIKLPETPAAIESLKTQNQKPIPETTTETVSPEAENPKPILEEKITPVEEPEPKEDEVEEEEFDDDDEDEDDEEDN